MGLILGLVFVEVGMEQSWLLWIIVICGFHWNDLLLKRLLKKMLFQLNFKKGDLCLEQKNEILFISIVFWSYKRGENIEMICSLFELMDPLKVEK